jgi:hypothetical protein
LARRDRTRQQLLVALPDAVDAAAGEESLAQVPDRVFDAPLVLGHRHGAQPGLDAEMGAQPEQDRMEADCIAVALDHHGLGVIEQPLPGDAAWRIG